MEQPASLCYPPLDWFWGRHEPEQYMRLLLVVPLALDLAKLLFLAWVYWAFEPNKSLQNRHAFTISEVFAWHQRQDASRHDSPTASGKQRHNDSVQGTAERLEQGPLRQRSFTRMPSDDRMTLSACAADVPPRLKPRWTAHMEMTLSGLSGVAWLLLLSIRRPWGLAIALVCVMLGGGGLMLFPLPEDPSQRTPRQLVGHYIFAVLTFAAFAGALAFGHGTCDPTLLAFVGMVSASGLAACASHCEPLVRSPCRAQGLTLLTAALEWSAVVSFYISLMVPGPGSGSQDRSGY